VIDSANRQPDRLGKSTTVGVLVDWLNDPYQASLLEGSLQGAKAAGAGLLCFVGEAIPADPTASARHRAFELIGRHNVDGAVVLASTLMHHVGQAGLTEYCKKYLSNLPLCTIGANLEGIPSLNSDNDRGIQELIAHLVGIHEHRRIAFVRGPRASEEAEQRFVAYVDSLKAHGLAYDERLVFVGDFTVDSGHEAVRYFAQIPGLGLKNIDAIAASNDNMAVGAVRALEMRGLIVPDAVAVTGFDDVEDASLCTSPLTTVRQSLFKLGRQAARSVLEWARLGTVPTNSEIATELVIRRSCGCSSQVGNLQQSIIPQLTCGFEAALLMRRQHILDTLVRAAAGGLGVAGRDWQTKLLNAFLSDLSGETSAALRSILEDLTEKVLARGGSEQPCHDVLDCLRRQMGGTLRNEPGRRDRAEEIYCSTQLAISHVVRRGLMRERFKIGRWGRDISATCNLFAGVRNLAELRNFIGTQLPLLGIPNHYVVTYRNHNPQCAELLIANDQGQAAAAVERAPFDAKSLLPPTMTQSLGGGRSFAVLPLARGNESLGHVLLELDLEHVYSYDAIASAIANGIYVSHLIEHGAIRA
jgi:DNA-binding LacI/PurR family transcriptional regulator